MESEGLAKKSADTKYVDEPENKYHGKPPAGAVNRGFKSLAVAASLPLVLGSIVGFLFPPDKWYFSLQKPSWNPPSWVFGLTWSLVYPIMGLASWLVWANGGWQKQGRALTLYLLQLGVNLLWSYLFFGLHSPLLALGDITVLIALVLACVQAFKPANHVAGGLMQVYLFWVLFATALNFSIWFMNLGHQSPPQPIMEVKH